MSPDVSEIIVRRTSAIGDSLSASVVADRLQARGQLVTFQSHPSNWCVLRRRRSIAQITKPEATPHVDLDGAYETDPRRKERHFAEMFTARANDCLRGQGIDLGAPINWKPRITLGKGETSGLKALLDAKEYPHPWIFICPKSNFWRVRQVPNYVWEAMARELPGTCFWIGTDPAPPGVIDLRIRHLDILILYLGLADLLVTVDTGPMHIGAALNAPIVAIGQSSSPDLHLNDQTDYLTVPVQNLDCLNCQQNICPKGADLPPCQNIDPGYLAQAVKDRLRSITSDMVSVVTPIYRPDVKILNRSLDCALAQADEVVVVVDTAGRIPEGARQDPKIRYLRLNKHDVGYGRKANYGFRHSHGRFVMLNNDDCFLGPGVIPALVKLLQANPTAGLACNILRYENGTIQHGGTIRAPGQRGWHHLDVGKFISSFEQPVEMENVTGASIMLRRSAYFDVNGHDEQFYLCCEDNDLCMKLRARGYKLIFTPQVSSIHLESTSTRNSPNFMDHVRRSCAILEQKWGEYWDWNKNRTPLGNFDYLHEPSI